MTYEPRPYTGLADWPARGRRPGTQYFVQSINFLTGGNTYNLGTYGIRPNKSNPKLQSVHGTGRAADIGRVNPKTGKAAWNWTTMSKNVVKPLIENAALFGIELVVEYEFGVGGRTWRCDRGTWIVQPAGRLARWPGIHVELDPAHADNPALIDAAWHQLFAGLEPAPVVDPVTPA